MNFGFLLTQLGDEIGELFIKQANDFLSDSHVSNYSDVIGFVANHTRPQLMPSFGIMNVNEAFEYNGIVVATSLDLAAKLIKFPGKKHCYYYAWNLDWMIYPNRTFEETLEVFQNPRLSIIARNNNDAAVIEKCWNRKPSFILPDCNLKQLYTEHTCLELKKKNL